MTNPTKILILINIIHILLLEIKKLLQVIDIIEYLIVGVS